MRQWPEVRASPWFTLYIALLLAKRKFFTLSTPACMAHNVSPKSSLKRRKHTLITQFNSQIITALKEPLWGIIFRCSRIIITNLSSGVGFRRNKFKKVYILTARSPCFFPLAWSFRADRPPVALFFSFLTLLNHPTKCGSSSQASTAYFWFFSIFSFPVTYFELKIIRTYRQIKYA